MDTHTYGVEITLNCYYAIKADNESEAVAQALDLLYEGTPNISIELLDEEE